MLGSAVPPCGTTTFSGGQFVTVAAVVVVPAEFDDDGSVAVAESGFEAEPVLASQPAVIGFFLRARFLDGDALFDVVVCDVVVLDFVCDWVFAFCWFAGALVGFALCD